jgi:hypothetical protein
MFDDIPEVFSVQTSESRVHCLLSAWILVFHFQLTVSWIPFCSQLTVVFFVFNVMSLEFLGLVGSQLYFFLLCRPMDLLNQCYIQQMCWPKIIVPRVPLNKVGNNFFTVSIKLLRSMTAHTGPEIW